MSSRPKFFDLKKPHFVGWVDRSDASEMRNYEEACFAAHEEAERRYDEICADPSKLAYLGEIGVFENNRGLTIDWLFYKSNDDDWWNRVAMKPGDPHRNVRGRGRPYLNEDSYVTPYKVISMLEEF